MSPIKVINKFNDSKGNLAELLSYKGRGGVLRHGVRCLHMGVSKMDIKKIGVVNDNTVYQTTGEGESTPDVAYASTDGPLAHCTAWMKERGFDLRGEYE